MAEDLKTSKPKPSKFVDSSPGAEQKLARYAAMVKLTPAERALARDAERAAKAAKEKP